MFPADPVSHNKEWCWAQWGGWKPPVRVRGLTRVGAARIGDGVHGKGGGLLVSTHWEKGKKFSVLCESHHAAGFVEKMQNF